VGTFERPYDFLVKDFTLQNLTAPERSQEWNSESRWYGGRGR
jgi:Ni/Co efflux regulator RcnB